MEVPRLGAELELRMSAYTPQPQQHQIQATSVTYIAACSNAGSFNSLREVRDQTSILMDTIRVLKPLSHNKNSQRELFYFILFYLFIWSFLGPHSQHTEVPGLEVKSEL